jgi:hypothetical protein
MPVLNILSTGRGVAKGQVRQPITAPAAPGAAEAIMISEDDIRYDAGPL